MPRMLGTSFFLPWEPRAWQESFQMGNQSINLSVYLCMYLPIYLSVYLSICVLILVLLLIASPSSLLVLIDVLLLIFVCYYQCSPYMYTHIFIRCLYVCICICVYVIFVFVLLIVFVCGVYGRSVGVWGLYGTLHACVFFNVRVHSSYD